MDKSLVSNYQSFLKSYDENAMNEIWRKQQHKFLNFWNTRVLDKTSPPLTDNEIDDIIRILDKNGKGNTKKDHAVAKAMIPQFKWRTIFRNIRDHESHSSRIEKILITKDRSTKIALLDELKEANIHLKNNLTGPSANAINCIMAAANPFENLSIISLNDRKKLMEHLGYQQMAEFESYSWGQQIVDSESFIFEKLNAAGISGNSRTISSFVYSSNFIGQWRLDEDDESTMVDDGATPYGNKSRIRFWMFAPGPGASQWDDNYKNGYMALGWPETGDLNNYENMEAIRSFFQKTKNIDSSFMNSVRATYEFNRVIAPGDFVVVKKGQSEFLGYGIVKSDYYYDPNKSDYNHLRDVEWKKRGSWKLEEGKVAVKTLTDITKYPEFVKELIELMEIDVELGTSITNSIKSKPNAIPLNTILFGPPGTGKTYHTIEHALRAINDADLNINSMTREELKFTFEQMRNEGRIVFTTFHQSMSYEDFVEGIKPNSENQSNLRYEVRDGIFKNLCENAHNNWSASKMADTVQLTFEQAFEKFTEEWEDNQNLTIPTKKKSFTITSISNRSIGFKKASGGTGHSLSINTLREFYYGTRDINNIQGLSSYYPGLLQKLKSYQGKSEQVILKNYVIIIDEINRGNVSQIFGELITLIEDNKRLGMPEQLEVELPYSNERFGVPPNLYIIGTMNTADRSVEALDTALRRRFNFVEKKPDYELPELQREVAGYKLANLLFTLNRRIEKLLDKDHQLGHSYLLEVGESIVALKSVFKNKFIPLLQEYFFGDYARLGLVLGEKFFMPSVDDGNLFASFRNVDTSDFINRPVYQLRDLDLMSDEEFEEAIQTMMSGQ